MALNCNASQHHHPDEMWYFKLASDMFNGNIIVVCTMRLCFLSLFQLVLKFYATHKIYWLNVPYYVRRIVVFAEDAAAILCCFWLKQRILIKLMPLMLPSSTNRNSTYVIYFYVYFCEARTAISFIFNHSLHLPTLLPRILQFDIICFFFIRKFKSKWIQR